jgi:3-oxoacyl-[acyl-carrier-protein] synthase-3
VSVLVNIASYIPEGRLDNLPSCERFAIQPSFLDEKIGTREVARRSSDEDAGTMGTAAARRLLEKTNLLVADIDAIIVVTQNPAGGGIPHTSARIQRDLGCTDTVACFDISLGCSGYVYGLSILGSFLEANGLQNGFLITADPYSPILDETEKNTVLLFGDAATASLIRTGDTGGWKIGPTLFATRGSAGTAIQNDSGLLQMKGRDVFEFCLREVPAQLRALLARTGLDATAIDAFVLHQGSKFIVEQIARAMALPPGKAPVYLEGIGNTVSSSIPLVLENKILSTDARRVILSGFGVGLSWASALLEKH